MLPILLLQTFFKHPLLIESGMGQICSEEEQDVSGCTGCVSARLPTPGAALCVTLQLKQEPQVWILALSLSPSELGQATPDL